MERILYCHILLRIYRRHRRRRRRKEHDRHSCLCESLKVLSRDDCKGKLKGCTNMVLQSFRKLPRSTSLPPHLNLWFYNRGMDSKWTKVEEWCETRLLHDHDWSIRFSQSSNQNAPINLRIRTQLQQLMWDWDKLDVTKKVRLNTD